MGLTLSLSYLCLMSFFSLHVQHGLEAACKPKNLRMEKFTTVSYFMIYTINTSSPGLAWRKRKKCFANSNLRVMTLSLSYLCLMSPFTLHGQHGLHSGSEPTNLKIGKNYNCILFYSIHNQQACYRPSTKKTNKK